MDNILRILKRKAAESGTMEDLERYVIGLERALGGVNPLDPPELDPEYGTECVIQTLYDTELRCPPAPEEASYIRVCDKEGEIVYWSYQEWEQAPQEVMGAIVGALLGGRISFSCHEGCGGKYEDKVTRDLCCSRFCIQCDAEIAPWEEPQDMSLTLCEECFEEQD